MLFWSFYLSAKISKFFKKTKLECNKYSSFANFETIFEYFGSRPQIYWAVLRMPTTLRVTTAPSSARLTAM